MNISIALVTLPLCLTLSAGFLSSCANSSSSSGFSPVAPEKPKNQEPIAKIEPFMIQGTAVSATEFQKQLDDVRTRQLHGANLQLRTLQLGEYRFTESGKWIFSGNGVDLQVNKNDCKVADLDLEVKRTQGLYSRLLGLTLSLPYWIQGIAQGPKMIGFTTPGIYSTDQSPLGIGTSPVILQTEAAFRPPVDITLSQMETERIVYFDLQGWDPSAKTLTLFAKFYTERGTVVTAILAYGPSTCHP